MHQESMCSNAEAQTALNTLWLSECSHKIRSDSGTFLLSIAVLAVVDQNMLALALRLPETGRKAIHAEQH